MVRRRWVLSLYQWAALSAVCLSAAGDRLTAPKAQQQPPQGVRQTALSELWDPQHQDGNSTAPAAALLDITETNTQQPAERRADVTHRRFKEQRPDVNIDWSRMNDVDWSRKDSVEQMEMREDVSLAERRVDTARNDDWTESGPQWAQKTDTGSEGSRTRADGSWSQEYNRHEDSPAEVEQDQVAEESIDRSIYFQPAEEDEYFTEEDQTTEASHPGEDYLTTTEGYHSTTQRYHPPPAEYHPPPAEYHSPPNYPSTIEQHGEPSVVPYQVEPEYSLETPCRRTSDDPDGDCIRGVADLDYPTLQSIPETGFSCLGRPPGFYADMETGCQVWHYCTSGGRPQSFLCTTGTVFSQLHLVCDWWFKVDCPHSDAFEHVNDRLYRPEEYSAYPGQYRGDGPDGAPTGTLRPWNDPRRLERTTGGIVSHLQPLHHPAYGRAAACAGCPHGTAETDHPGTALFRSADSAPGS
ncbi:hypothetical protein FJT64_012507 [Amphibalanus amphitrite]|uniref:Chitin-binding type-2 domain-containing protein n=1 Tax=Amphibalanus amphitrite TaxID=1232801 RepID=A0A6A4VFK3_AMPAM|nr:hypothetical protein FJT64_012507 [Amphibalanus amphitrite]